MAERVPDWVEPTHQGFDARIPRIVHERALAEGAASLSGATMWGVGIVALVLVGLFAVVCGGGSVAAVSFGLVLVLLVGGPMALYFTRAPGTHDRLIRVTPHHFHYNDELERFWELPLTALVRAEAVPDGLVVHRRKGEPLRFAAGGAMRWEIEKVAELLTLAITTAEPAPPAPTALREMLGGDERMP
ncbi:MAG: hypothetical protein KC656_32550 [Myxococcales bacterium]|nr:hypothetical protein [Myxococcales bacterium]